MKLSAARPPRARLLADESGFTLVELLVTIVILAGGMLATIGVMDRSRALVSLSERKEAGVHVAERVMEQTLARSYDTVGLTPTPAHNSDPEHPFYRVLNGAAGAPARYQWDHGDASRIEPIVSQAAGGIAPGPSGLTPGSTSWSDGRLSGRVYRLVTWVDDPWTAPTRDYKRITIVSDVNGNEPLAPVVMSSIMSRR